MNLRIVLGVMLVATFVRLATVSGVLLRKMNLSGYYQFHAGRKIYYFKLFVTCMLLAVALIVVIVSELVR
jgi:hypothetical protein